MVIYIILVFYGVLIISRLGCHFLVAFTYMGGVQKHQPGLLTSKSIWFKYSVRCVYKTFLDKPGGWNHLENLNVDGIVVLKWMFKKCYGGGTCNGLLSQGQRYVTGSCECGNEPPSSIKCQEILGRLRDCQPLKKDSVPQSQHLLFNSI